MVQGKRQTDKQKSLWMTWEELPKSPGHPFYKSLNRLLSAHGFDSFCQEKCKPFYADKMGRPSLPPEIYFRLMLVGYFEGIDSERGIAWR